MRCDCNKEENPKMVTSKNYSNDNIGDLIILKLNKLTNAPCEMRSLVFP